MHLYEVSGSPYTEHIVSENTSHLWYNVNQYVVPPNAAEETATPSPATSNTQSTVDRPSSTPSSSIYDPSKCDPLKAQADSLKTASVQKKTTYDTASAYERIMATYDQCGNSMDAQRAHDAQEAQLNSLQTD